MFQLTVQRSCGHAEKIELTKPDTRNLAEYVKTQMLNSSTIPCAKCINPEAQKVSEALPYLIFITAILFLIAIYFSYLIVDPIYWQFFYKK